MTKRRSLTAQEKIAQQQLRAIWQAKKKTLDLTQEKAAHLLGWSSQGTVGQYLLGRVPLNTDALLKFAKLLQVSPTDIDPDFQWGELVNGQKGSDGNSYTRDVVVMLDNDDASPPAKAEIPRHVRELVESILKCARDGYLTKEHTAALKNTLELMTSGKK